MDKPFKVPTRLRAGYTLMLRTCAADMSSHGGFAWPRSGAVECPDWDPAAHCGNGLHGLLRGVGDGSLLCWDEDAQWLVVEVKTADVVDIKNKVKVPRGRVLHTGARLNALALMQRLGHLDDMAVGSTLTGGDRSTLTGGDRSTLLIKWWDLEAKRYRHTLGEVGESGIVAGGRYQLDNEGQFVRIDDVKVPATPPESA